MDGGGHEAGLEEGISVSMMHLTRRSNYANLTWYLIFALDTRPSTLSISAFHTFPVYIGDVVD